MSHVRRDYFKTHFPELEPPVWLGITLQDMIVLDVSRADDRQTDE